MSDVILEWNALSVIYSVCWCCICTQDIFVHKVSLFYYIYLLYTQRNKNKTKQFYLHLFIELFHEDISSNATTNPDLDLP